MRLVVTPATDGAALALHIRIPGWLDANLPIFLNGEVLATGTPASYCTLERNWNRGDTLTFTLKKNWRITRYTGATQVEGRERYALEYGPLLMALCGPLQSDCLQGPEEPTIGLDMSPSDLCRRLAPTETDLCFAVDGLENMRVRPYYEVQQETFTCFPAFLPPGQE